MRMYDVIRKKRDRKELSREEIEYAIMKYTEGEIPDYQMSALLMAIYLNKMTEEETLDLTRCMVESGDKIDLSGIEGLKVDKHSTGGVGDTVTLVLGPMVAACGVPFAKMSGRGLGHTGGTLDKLEAIDGFRIELTNEEFNNIINDIKISICGQTENAAPADKKIYALRDVTATVDNISLIAASIMSKKLAINSDGIVLDVKVGSGAFMKTEEEAVKLASEMVSIGKGYGRDTVALVTNMDEPLGRAIGNNIEVIEAIETLKGEGPEDLERICIELGAEMLVLAKKYDSIEDGREAIKAVIEDGSALDKLVKMVEYQGGDSACIKDTSLFPKARHEVQVKSDKDGYIGKIDAEKLGEASLILGAGRETMESELDLTAGILLNKKVDDRVEKDEVILTLYTNDGDSLEAAEKSVREGIEIVSKQTQNKKDLIINRID